MASQRKSTSSQNRAASSQARAKSSQARGAASQARAKSSQARTAAGPSGQARAAAGPPRQPPPAASGSKAMSGRAPKGGQASRSGSETQAAERASGPPWRVFAVPRSMGWLKFTTLVLSVIGLVVSAYLTYTHFTNTALLGCSAKGDGCVTVQTSSEAEVFGIFPVAVLGLAFYVFMVAANSPWAWRSKLPAVHWARLGSVVIGMIFVLYLVYAELVEIGAICKYCTSVHIITFILFGLIVFQATSPDSAVTSPLSSSSSRRKG